MKQLLHIILAGFLALGIVGAATGADKGSSEEATAMVKKAAAYLKANGKEKAFAEFSNPAGQFKDRDLYLTAIDLNGNVLAHGANAKLIGKSVLDMKDADGNAFIKGFIEVANAKGKGWVDYKWPNPVSKAIEKKSSYVEKVDGVVLSCGVYKG